MNKVQEEATTPPILLTYPIQKGLYSSVIIITGKKFQWKTKEIEKSLESTYNIYDLTLLYLFTNSELEGLIIQYKIRYRDMI